MLATRPRILHVEPNAAFPAVEDGSVTSATAESPITPLTASTVSEAENEGDASVCGSEGTSPLRRRRRSKEKKKRSRVTPEQLVQLEHYFSIDRSPTAARRREISELLGMQERQTQIWFQNRRAKAKMLDGKPKDRSAPETSLTSLKYAELKNTIHEDEAVTIIPCTDLSVGTWRRIATSVHKHDLVAYVCEAKQSLTWFIISGGNGFKMEIPFDRIVNTEFRHTSPGIAHAVFILSDPPLFFLEHPMNPHSDLQTQLSWRRCSDWTEGAQATQVLRHNLLGSAPQLSHLIQRLEIFRLEGKVSPSYDSDSLSSPVEIPAPPMAGLLPSPPRYGSVSADGVEGHSEIMGGSGQLQQTSGSGFHITAAVYNQVPIYGGGYSDAENPYQQQLEISSIHPMPIARSYSAAPVETFPSMGSDVVSIAHSLQGFRRHIWPSSIPNYNLGH
ncbi:hypothetical protein D9757_008532 [Collybiopsis confluens]|uniref:Homeobox domain-containing protein n=1 Tax=Collybiopsis confluens TaxID=2823264 RepID=A0A8H5LZY2_9AGAR|nr:hypothetical protein D9757_008532 [Collybiopsis confluens]